MITMFNTSQKRTSSADTKTQILHSSYDNSRLEGLMLYKRKKGTRIAAPDMET
jgi:hypothetical protein